MRRRRAAKAIGHLEKAEEEIRQMVDNGEGEDREKQEIKERVDALDARVRVLERRSAK